jgi:hypothetical protein
VFPDGDSLSGTLPGGHGILFGHGIVAARPVIAVIAGLGRAGARFAIANVVRARAGARRGIAPLLVVQLPVAAMTENNEIVEFVSSPLAERNHVMDLGAVAVLAELADEPRADQRRAADLGRDRPAAPVAVHGDGAPARDRRGGA